MIKFFKGYAAIILSRVKVEPSIDNFRLVVGAEKVDNFRVHIREELPVLTPGVAEHLGGLHNRDFVWQQQQGGGGAILQKCNLNF